MTAREVPTKRLRSQMTRLGSLPPEIIQLIIEQLDSRSQAELSRTCSWLNRHDITKRLRRLFIHTGGMEWTDNIPRRNLLYFTELHLYPWTQISYGFRDSDKYLDQLQAAKKAGVKAVKMYRSQALRELEKINLLRVQKFVISTVDPSVSLLLPKFVLRMPNLTSLSFHITKQLVGHKDFKECLSTLSLLQSLKMRVFLPNMELEELPIYSREEILPLWGVIDRNRGLKHLSWEFCNVEHRNRELLMLHYEDSDFQDLESVTEDILPDIWSFLPPDRISNTERPTTSSRPPYRLENLGLTCAVQLTRLKLADHECFRPECLKTLSLFHCCDIDRFVHGTGARFTSLKTLQISKSLKMDAALRFVSELPCGLVNLQLGLWAEGYPFDDTCFDKHRKTLELLWLDTCLPSGQYQDFARLKELGIWFPRQKHSKLSVPPSLEYLRLIKQYGCEGGDYHGIITKLARQFVGQQMRSKSGAESNLKAIGDGYWWRVGDTPTKTFGGPHPVDKPSLYILDYPEITADKNIAEFIEQVKVVDGGWYTGHPWDLRVEGSRIFSNSLMHTSWVDLKEPL